MTHTTLPEEILKTDVLGRVRTPRARREALLEEFERSGVSAQKFAALVGVKYQTFASWVQQRRKARGQYQSVAKKVATPVRRAEMLSLVEAVVESATADRAVPRGEAVLRVELPGGARLEIGELRQVMLAAALLRALVREEQGC